MARVYLVRHGEPSGTWTDARDPGLSQLGHQQAKAAAEQLSAFGALNVVSSPMKRAQETAAPFATLRRVQAQIADAVAEIPTPAHVAFDRRGEWLRAVLTGKWSEADASLQSWRFQVIDFLKRLPSDTAIFSHYVAINVAVASARKDDRVTVFAPTHVSITILDATPDALIEVELGRTGETAVR